MDIKNHHHRWGKWRQKVGLPKPVWYRVCTDEDCAAHEEQEGQAPT